MMPHRRGFFLSSITAVLALVLASCGSTREAETSPSTRSGGFLGIGGSSGEPAGIGVNSFLWRASLDTLNFMPLASADPYGGVIITDWYADPAQPNERFKATVTILDTRLRADGLNVNIHRQTFDAARGWLDAPTDAETPILVENAILERARQLRIGALGE